MKQLSRLLVVALFVIGYNNVQAQDEDNPWAITFGINAIDVYPVGDASLPTSGNGTFDEFFNVNDHWNIVPSISYVSVQRYIGDGFVFGVRGSLNRLQKLGDIDVDNLSHYAVDGLIKYNILSGTKFVPFAQVGGGYTWVDEIGAGTVNGGVGVDWWLTENFGLNIETKRYRNNHHGTRTHGNGL